MGKIHIQIAHISLTPWSVLDASINWTLSLTMNPHISSSSSCRLVGWFFLHVPKLSFLYHPLPSLHLPWFDYVNALSSYSAFILHSLSTYSIVPPTNSSLHLHSPLFCYFIPTLILSSPPASIFHSPFSTPLNTYPISPPPQLLISSLVKSLCCFFYSSPLLNMQTTL